MLPVRDYRQCLYRPSRPSRCGFDHRLQLKVISYARELGSARTDAILERTLRDSIYSELLNAYKWGTPSEMAIAALCMDWGLPPPSSA